MIIEKHTDPTGVMVLAVEKADDGLISIGFQNSEWHTHPEMLVGEYGETEESALTEFKRAIFEDEIVIAIVRRGGHPVDISVTTDPDSIATNLAECESLERRYWSGRQWFSPTS